MVKLAEQISHCFDDAKVSGTLSLVLATLGNYSRNRMSLNYVFLSPCFCLPMVTGFWFHFPHKQIPINICILLMLQLSNHLSDTTAVNVIMTLKSVMLNRFHSYNVF